MSFLLPPPIARARDCRYPGLRSLRRASRLDGWDARTGPSLASRCVWPERGYGWRVGGAAAVNTGG